MFVRSAHLYDVLYAAKDYPREADRIHELIQEHKRSAGTALLDVGCGTGGHLAHLRRHYAVEGLDVSSALLEIARERLPGVVFHQADMADFALGTRFDAVVCLFGSIGYVKTPERLRRALRTMHRHSVPGGVILVEPWLTPETYQPGLVHALFADRPDLKVARMNVSEMKDGVSVLDFHYLVATPDGVEHFTERHELGLFSDGDYLDAFGAVGIQPIHDAEGLIGRGLYIGVRPI